MRAPHLSKLFCFGSLALPALAGLSIRDAPLFKRQGSDDQVLAYFEAVGQCFLYLESVSESTYANKQLGPCKTYCEGQGSSIYSCNSYDGVSSVGDVEDKDMIQYDDDLNSWIPSTCNCEEGDDGSGPDPDPDPTTTDGTPEPTSTDAITCSFCSSSQTERRRKRWGVMLAPRDEGDDDVCLIPGEEDQPAADSCVISASDLRRGIKSLAIRALDTKTEPVGIIDPKLEMVFGQYPPCSDAKADNTVPKYYRLPNNDCIPDVRQVFKKESGTIPYETDHVYEAQTLRDFFRWLASNPGGLVGSHTTLPTQDWVENVLLHDLSTKRFMLVSPGKGPGAFNTPANGDSLDEVLVYGFGRVDGSGSTGKGMTKALTVKNLALLDALVNNKKGKWFGGATPEAAPYSKDYEVRLNMKTVQTGAAPFHFLRLGLNTPDAVWDKWMRVSNWIDLVLDGFDKQYPWGQNNPGNVGEPTRDDNQNPSLRGLYAYWIDAYLGTIEATAQSWGVLCETRMKSTHPQMTPKEQAWMQNAFGTNGWASSTALLFPRPSNVQPGASVYGAWGKEDMCFDAAGKAVTGLGIPLAP